MRSQPPVTSFFFFNDTATTEIYTLSLHDALPICPVLFARLHRSHICRIIKSGKKTERIQVPDDFYNKEMNAPVQADRKSTRLNSSHSQISYAVFCLKKKSTSQNTVRATAGVPCTA